MAITVGNTTASRGPAAEAATMTFAHDSNGTFLVTTGQWFRPRTPSSYTYNGTGMSQAAYSASTYDAVIYYLASPTGGSNNCVLTLDSTSGITGSAISLSGVNASPLGNTTTATGTSNSPSTALTTTAANSYIINSIYRNNSQTMTAGGSQVEFQDNADLVYGTEGGGASYLACTSVTSYNMSWSWSTSTDWSHAVAEFKEASSTTIKTWNGIVRANLKSLNGTLSANIKKINGIT
tara:strand:+ start:375 stop:1082 length:708 start_codon:yes stop_codon:yes gene_type:complete